MGAGNLATSLIPEAMDNSLSYSVLNYLKRLKNQAKIEYDRIVQITPYKGKVGPDGIKVIQRSPLSNSLAGALSGQVTDFPGYMLGLPQQKGGESHPLRNPFDIPRNRLLDQLVRMRANLIGGGRGRVGVQLVDADTRHSLPISSMGNYQDYLKKQPPPLKDVEEQPVRQHMFGNPFKINKNLMMTDEVGVVDEVQLVGVGGVGGPQPGAGRGGVKRPGDQLGVGPLPPKRRKGALPKDFQYVSPSNSPRSSPAHSVEYINPHHVSLPPAIPLPLPLPLPLPVQSPPPAPPRHLSNGVTVPGGLGPVYAGGKMAAFKSLCDTDLDNDCDEPLMIAETSAADNINPVQIEDNEEADEEEDEEEEEEEIIELPVPVENHVKHTVTPQDKKAPSNARDEVTILEVKKEKPPTTLVNGSSDHDVNHGNHKNSVLTNQSVNLDTENHIKNNHVAKEPDRLKLSSDELRSIYLRNNNVRQLIYKEVKRPGKAHSELWEMLANLHGPAWVRREFIQEVKKEALR